MKTVLESPGFLCKAFIDTDFVAYFVPISTSMPLACTFNKLYSLARNSGYPN